jgi:hypothetical protein
MGVLGGKSTSLAKHHEAAKKNTKILKKREGGVVGPTHYSLVSQTALLITQAKAGTSDGQAIQLNRPT